MAQRTFTLTGVITDFSGAFVVGAACSFQPLTPAGTGAIDGNGAVVQTEAKPFTTNASGAFVQLDGTSPVVVDYPGDYQAPYVNTQVRVIVNNKTTDSPIGFGYVSSIDYSSWIIAPATSGKVTMRVVYTQDDGTGIGSALGSVAISQPATVVATGEVLSAVNPVVRSSASDGTMTFPLDPNSLINPSSLNYGLQITNPDGTIEPTVWYFIVPSVVDVYRGTYNNGTTYSAAAGSSNGDVVVSASVLYRFINGTPSAGHAPPNATYWQVVSGLPTDLITAHLNGSALAGQIATLQTGIAADSAVLTGSFTNPPVTLQDELRKFLQQAFRDTGAWSGATAYVPNDVVLVSGTYYLCILAHTNHTPPNATYWSPLGSAGSFVPLAGGTMTGELIVPDVNLSGLTGSVAAGRFVGFTATGAPTTGAHLVGDKVFDQTGKGWTCTAAGTPGTWVQEPGTGGGSLPTVGSAGQAILSDGTEWIGANPAGVVGSPDALTTDYDLPYFKRVTVSAVTIEIAGDSTVAGTLVTTPPSVALATDLSTATVTVTVDNQGHSGATSADWIVGAGSGYLTTMLSAAASNGARDALLIIGTNDAKTAVATSTATFRSNLLSWVNAVIDAKMRPWLGVPVYLGAVTGSFDAGSPARVASYVKVIDELADEGKIFLADGLGYGYFKATPAALQGDLVHPTQTGSDYWAGLWAEGMRKGINARSGYTTRQRLPGPTADGLYLGQSAGVFGYSAPPGAQILMQDGSASPPLPLWNEAGDDYLYQG